jgi:hypothetical protein
MAWYDTDWPYRFKVTIDGDKIHASDTYAVLIAHDNVPKHFWYYVSETGSDIVITSSDEVTKLNRDVPCITVDDEALAIRFPAALTAGQDAVFYVYYGNASATETDSTDAYPASWKCYVGLDETGAGAPSTLFDRTSNDNDLTAVSIVQNSGTQNIGHAMVLDGTSDYAHATDDATLDITDNITVMCWVRGSDPTPDTNEWIFTKYKTTTDDRSWGIRSGSSSGALFQVYISDDGTFDAGHRKQYESSVTAIENGTWHHLAFTFASGSLKMYVDGVEDTSVTKTNDDAISSIYSGAASLVIGADGDFGTKWGTGYVDEFKVIAEVLTANEIKTYYEMEGATETFYAVSEISSTASMELNIRKINGVSLQVEV